MQEPNTLTAETSPLTEAERSAVSFLEDGPEVTDITDAVAPPLPKTGKGPWDPPAALLDIVHGGYGVTPLAGKRPLRSGWQVEPIRSGLEWIDSGHTGNHGIVLREEDRLLLVDVDVKGDRDGREAFTELVNAVNLNPKPYLIQRTPSGGFHLLGRIPEGYPAGRLPNGATAPGIDVLRDHKQFVRAPGRTQAGEYREVLAVRRPHGKKEGLPPLAKLPEWPAAFLDLLAERAGSSTELRTPEELQAPAVDWVREAVRKIPNDSRFASRDAWIKMAYAIKAAVGPENVEDGLQIFSEFSDRWEDGENDPSEVERAYRTARHPARVGWQWIAELSGETAALAQEEFEADQTIDPETLPVEPSDPAGNRVARFAQPLEEIEYTGPPGFLLDRLILESDINFYAGDGGSFKTTGAIATACAVASGSDLFDHRNPNRPQRVLYVSEEDDADQIKNKADAIVAGSEMEIPAGFLEIMALRGFTFGSPEWEKDLRSYVRDGGFGLVVFDPLAEMQRGKENSNDDARPIVRFLRSITARGGPAVLVVHHAGKGSEGQSKIDRFMRGASGFKNGARSIMGFRKESDGFLVTPLKLSRTALPDSTSVTVRITTDPEDEHGIRWERASFEGAPRWKVEREKAEWAIRDVLEEAGTLNATDLRKEVTARGHKPPAVSKARDALERRGVIDYDPGDNGAKMWFLVEPEIPVEEGVGIPEDSD